MLIQFSVKNYMSFREKAVLAMNPSADAEHPENIIAAGDYKATNAIAIYGANASGKTSLLKAMTVALIMIRQSNIMQVNQPIPGIAPFKFDEKSGSEPSEFEFIFVADDGVRYVYGFSADKTSIKEEYLFQYKSQRPALIFKREDEKYEFKAQRKILEPLVRFNTWNKLFLATATNWNAECTTIPFRWFAEKFITFTDALVLKEIAYGLYRSPLQKDYVKFTEELLRSVDINISRIDVAEKGYSDGSANGGFGLQPIYINGQPVQMGGYSNSDQLEVRTEHVVDTDKGKEKYTLDISEESLGTNQLFILGPFLKDAFDNGVVVVIDEIDRSLHSFIVKYIIGMFRDASVNKAGAQLIFTTHDTSLLSLSTFRRDQIYFTEKESKNGGAKLYSLDEFSVRKSENIEKGYLLGRYGAVPSVRGGEV